jgi:hypothetical protein
MIIMWLVSVDIFEFLFTFILLQCIYRLYNPVGVYLLFVELFVKLDILAFVHRMLESYKRKLSSFEHLLQHVIFVIYLGMFFA